MMTRWIAVLLLGFAVPAGAHHSFASIYDSSKQLTLEGTVAEFHFVHPHPFLFVQVNVKGKTHTWRAEMDNRFELTEIGITAETFKPGDRVVITGDPGRNEPRILYLWKLDRPADGLRYEQIGGTPRVTTDAT